MKLRNPFSRKEKTVDDIMSEHEAWRTKERAKLERKLSREPRSTGKPLTQRLGEAGKSLLSGLERMEEGFGNLDDFGLDFLEMSQPSSKKKRRRHKRKR